MIYDKIENCDKYLGISHNLDRALDFIKNQDLNSLKPGRNEISGDELFVMLFEYETKDESEAVYESHKKYIDIQLLISGEETFRATTFDNQEVINIYNEDKDIEFFNISNGVDFHLCNGFFVLVMPGELHSPSIKYKKRAKVKKLVFKIKIK